MGGQQGSSLYSYLKRAKTEYGFHFTPEAEEIREAIFHEMDVDHNGQIDQREIELMWPRFNQAYSRLMAELKMENTLDRSTFDKLMAAFDSVEFGGNNDGLLNCAEFSAMLLHITNSLDLNLGKDTLEKE